MTTETPLTSQNTVFAPLNLEVDPEHTGIRTVGCLAFFASSVIIYFISASIFPMFGLLNIFIAAIVATGITYTADFWMKKNWRSGRLVTVRPEKIVLLKRDKEERAIDAKQEVNMLLWQFIVSRNTRVPKGWHVVACSLQQQDTYLPVYTLMSPNTYSSFELASQFTRLESKKNTSGKTESLKLAGLQRRLHDAETDRSLYGAEMTNEQFVNYITHLQTHFPDWMP